MYWTNKKRKILLSILLCSFLGLGTLNAQVTIGNPNKPESYSTLQLEDGKGGLRLPRYLNDAERDSKLTSQLRDDATGKSKPSATGLVIYNLGSNRAEFWDSTADSGAGSWFALHSGGAFSVASNNGLTTTGGTTVKLGGKLDTDVEIELKDQLNLTATDAGSLTIGTDKMVVKNNMVGIGTTTPTRKVDVVSPIVGKAFRLVDGSEKITAQENPNWDKVLTADANRKLSWKQLKDAIVKVEGTVTANVYAKATALNIAGEGITLKKGKWLVLTKVLFIGNTSGFYAWVSLTQYNKATNTLGSSINSTGMSSQNLSGQYYTVAPMTYLLNVTEDDTTYTLAASTSSTYGVTTQSSFLINGSQFGQSYFYAIRLGVN